MTSTRLALLSVACMVSTATVFGQTYMTTDDSVDFDSSLHRFDGETESFSVDAGGGSAFLGVTLLDDIVLVSDYIQERIQRYDLDGNLLAPFAIFTNPQFLESDSSKNVYTTFWGLGPAVATRFDSLGNQTETYSSPTASIFSGIDADANGNVWIATYSDSTLEKYAPDGTFLSSTAISANPVDISIDEAGQRLFVSNELSDTAGVQVYDISSGSPVFSGTIPTPVDSLIAGIHYAPEFDTVFAAETGIVSSNPRGLQLALDGTVLATYLPSDTSNAWDITHYVPEPGSAVLLGLACVGLVARVRVRRAR